VQRTPSHGIYREGPRNEDGGTHRLLSNDDGSGCGSLGRHSGCCEDAGEVVLVASVSAGAVTHKVTNGLPGALS